MKTTRWSISLLLACTGTTLILLQLYNLRTYSSCERHYMSQHERSRGISASPDTNQNGASGDEIVKGAKSTSCPIIDFLATIDVSARLYDQDLVCDELAPITDIVCRMYFRQIGLEYLARSTCVLDKPGRVPKIVYFVIFGTYVFRFWHYIAFMAAKRNISPSAIYVIGDQHPQGRWWQRVLTDVHGVR